MKKSSIQGKMEAGKKEENENHLQNAMLKILRQEGFKITEQRRLIVEAVAAQVGWHVHPKSVYAYVKKHDDKIGIATVYRTLKILDDVDVLSKVYSGRDVYHEEKESKHFHMICVKCGAMYDIDDTVHEDMKHQMLRDYNFFMDDMSLSVYGMCGACKKKSL